DAQCGAGQVCRSCACENAPVCTSGIPLGRPSLTLTSSPFRLALRGEAVIPKPWTGVDPATNGVRIAVGAVAGPGGLDVTIPGGAGWVVGGRATRWVYTDRTGAHGGITSVSVRDA